MCWFKYHDIDFDISSYEKSNKDVLTKGVEEQIFYKKYKEWAIRNEKEARCQHDFVKYFTERRITFSLRFDNPQRKVFYKLKKQVPPPSPPMEEEKSTVLFELVECDKSFDEYSDSIDDDNAFGDISNFYIESNSSRI